ncbi:MAG: hypothetical protein FWG88_09260 [Oscillospiraceae bacterium]|nr:hypothetical protein [Oscillospiraceae bacterium]
MKISQEVKDKVRARREQFKNAKPGDKIKIESKMIIRETSNDKKKTT